jgi:hypothetical protein
MKEFLSYHNAAVVCGACGSEDIMFETWDKDPFWTDEEVIARIELAGYKKINGKYVCTYCQENRHED